MRSPGIRLAAAAQLTPPCAILADVGSDHGKLALYLLEQKKCGFAIVTDISRDSLAKARKLFSDRGMNGSADFRVGDGLSVLARGEAQVAVIAGMGGRLIADILERGRKTAERMQFVLQPMQQTNDLRRYLRTNGFCIADENMAVQGGRYYATILAKCGAQSGGLAPEVYDEAGPVLFARRNMLALEGIRREITALERNRDDSVAQVELNNRLELLKHIETEWGK